ncbi:MAG: hypothetical protein QF578_03595 [Alphaproteobacteria bacterium]|jgi:hypothetical protein|nr:hypothetical protein [Alphaproteobacteria bacterium]MDP6563885.1 hypothetical protein [Alphaproteobacteria bacterium]MDP6815923.1 hypothetical protein [Alphaproteobacteria bacterium]
MKRTGSRGLMAFWADIGHDHTLRFQQWHNCEHIHERVGIPGFNVGRRYRGIGEAPKFLMFYETDDAAVLGSEPYLERLNDPTPWTQESLPYFRNPMRNIYGLVAEHGAPAPTEAPYMHVFRFNLPDGEGALDWHGQQWLPAVSAIDEVHRGRLYAVDEAISGIMTSERQIYGGGPGQQKYLAMFETTCPDTSTLATWQAAEQGCPDAADHLAGRRDLFCESSWLEIALYGAK